MATKIPKRISTAILQSLGAGVVPRTGAEHIAVGRKSEIEALLYDLDDVVAEGGATFRLVVGRYGSGKSFLIQLIRNYALQRNFVVADGDLSPQRRLTGSKDQGLALYRELLNNMATRTRPDGNAFAAILEKWISNIQSSVIQSGITPSAPNFTSVVEQQIHTTIDEMEGMVHGFDFAAVINTYWQGHQNGNDELKGYALRWLRGEFSTKTEARQALGVRVIIDDESWYDYIKLMAQFVRHIGYKGLIIFIDEAVNLYKISHTISRNNNYERLLTIYNDTLQGKAEHLGVLVGATPQMVEDTRRGLFSYEALKTRLEESRFARDGLRDMTGPLIRLDVLSHTEIYLLLQRVREVHSQHYKYEPTINDAQIQTFMTEVLNRIGSDTLLTPREVIRDFVALLNILYQNPDKTFEFVLGDVDLTSIKPHADPEMLTPETEIHDDGEESPYASFKI
ncbi:MAG: ATP-binding protein [Anaerolineae bacterium]|nr:ATP-binding protein [Anaerolineae bacterium]